MLLHVKHSTNSVEGAKIEISNKQAIEAEERWEEKSSWHVELTQLSPSLPPHLFIHLSRVLICPAES